MDKIPYIDIIKIPALSSFGTVIIMTVTGITPWGI